MFFKRLIALCFFSILLPAQIIASPVADQTQLAVWVNEAIVATYTYDYENFIERQKDIAKYFTSNGWIEYSKALLKAKLPDAVKKNAYVVSAVALMPPDIKTLKNNQWQALMPLLVVYKNPSYQQKQTLTVKLTFIVAPEGSGVRGFAITDLQTQVTEPPCECAKVQKMKAVV